MVEQSLRLPRKEERYYIDISTAGLVPGAVDNGVSGTFDNFQANIEPLSLNQGRHYTVEVHSWYYENINISPNVYPIILCDLGKNIIVNNTNSSIMYKSRVGADNTNFVALDQTNNGNFILDLSRDNIRNVRIEVVRSDNGQPFPLTAPHTLTFLIKNTN